ncbi:hypothetical protein BH683_008935 [Williamsia sp. 1138]|uniref:ABC transporter permease n=1 Tax=Williamsia sp. 1138 TaxID=1903117 RepID=UPI000A10590D|nr:hypothetical protein [Williamsia sp. 1138]OZG29553.1 hypothetical protein BH683_008935 [Williamsia sp. 1138]
MRTAHACATLLRLSFREDRVLAATWVVLLTTITWVSADATKDLYGSGQMRAAAVSALNATPAVTALYGRMSPTVSLGEMAILKPFMMGTIAVGVITAVIAIRHTRAGEESGRTDLLIAAGAARNALVINAYVSASAVSVAFGAAASISLLAVGLPTAGALAVGAAWTMVGLLFASTGVLCAQVFGTVRAARSAIFVLIGCAYLIRALADSSSFLSWLRWLSPVGWAQQVRPFAEEQWWPLTLLGAATVVVALCGVPLARRRDVGAASWSRPDESTDELIRTRSGLVWRLIRTGFLTWAIGIAALSAVVGNVAANADSFLGNQAMADYLSRLGGSGAVVDSLYSAELGYIGLLAAAFAIYVILQISHEESARHLDLLLTATPSRRRWVTAHLLIAAGGSVVLMGTAGTVLATFDIVNTGDTGHAGHIIAASMGQVPAIWLMAAVAVLVYGLTRHAQAVVWALLVAVVTTGILGPLIDTNFAIENLSPFSHTPTLADLDAVPATVFMLGVAAAATFAGIRAFDHRDVVPG